MQSIKVRFWGVRGSIPTPGSQTVKTGGNTSCVEINFNNTQLILDAGTGIRLLGNHFEKDKKPVHLFLSHYHLDHIWGLPFFIPLYQKGKKIHLYGPQGKSKNLKKVIHDLFSDEFFPIAPQNLGAKIIYHTIQNKNLKIGDFIIKSLQSNHPGKTLSYAITIKNKKIVYLTDHEAIHRFNHVKEIKNYSEKLFHHAKNADVLIHDSHFFDDEYQNFIGWGHSSWRDAIEFAHSANCKKLVLFHHGQNRSDVELAKEFQKIKKSKLKIELATEKKIITLS